MCGSVENVVQDLVRKIRNVKSVYQDEDFVELENSLE